MLRIRMRRMGGKNKVAYRVVVNEKRSKLSGRAVEELGHYNPRTNPPALGLDLARVEHWLAHGAIPTPTVARLIRMAQERDAKAVAPSVETPAPVEAAAPPAEAVAGAQETPA